MKLHRPFRISSHLMPTVQFGYLTIALDIDIHEPYGRTRYRYVIESGGRTYEATDLRSGIQGGTVAEGFVSLLAFLEAAGEAYLNHRNGHISENSGMFPDWVEELAHHYSDELAAFREELAENPESFIEE